jgi:hypothetical protein
VDCPAIFTKVMDKMASLNDEQVVAEIHHSTLIPVANFCLLPSDF